MVPPSLQSRPKSRQSTTSVASNQTQPILQREHTFVAAHPGGMPVAVWQQQQQHQQHQHQHQQQQQQQDSVMAQINQQFAEGYAPMMGTISRNITPSPAIGYTMNAPPPLQVHPAFTHSQHALQNRDSPISDIGMEMGTAGTKNAANDNELRRLLRENESKTLDNIAQQFQKDEPTSKLEKLKQIFGMIWLKKHVRGVEGQTIPRNSVYNEYQFSCGDFKLPSLNSASFGKLVRIIFPKIQTRRLGVRGASKYHYVGLTLLADRSRMEKPRGQIPAFVREASTSNDGLKATPARHGLPQDNTFFGPAVHTTTDCSDASMRHAATATLYQPSFTGGLRSTTHEVALLSRPLKFPESLDRLSMRDAKFELPDIAPYLPPGTDEDAANCLVSVYRSHCILAIDNFRYCKTEKFCESYKSLVGLLTVPGQKLLATPSIAPWIRECDWRKYQSMIPMLNMIILTQVPQKATIHMQDVARSLCSWIQSFFANQTSQLLSAMLGPASVFVSILERFCRVQNAALQVAPVLDSVEKRNELWSDWVSFVNPLHVVQNSLAGWGHRRCRLILTREIQLLLSPSEGPPLGGTFFEADGEETSQFTKMESSKNSRNSSDLIARLYRFLLSIRSRFQSASTREILGTIERITSNATRNMTLAGAQTVPDWWRLKVFIDEVAYWLAEMGGLFENDSEVLAPQLNVLTNETLYDFSGFDAVDSRPPTGNEMGHPLDSPNPELSHADSNSNGQPSRPVSTAPVLQLESGSQRPPLHKEVDMHEDSGIGLGLDDDFGMDHKFPGYTTQGPASDAVDVVVC